MDRQQLQKEILDCIWSKDLRSYVEEHNYRFSDPELVSIAYQFAPTYDERLRLLQLLAEQAPEVSQFASRCVRFQQECLEQFCRQGENEIYELRIMENPDAYEERYLCASYRTALDMIDGFYRAYGNAVEKDTTRYEIVKRRILQQDDAFQEDGLQECILGAGKALISAEIWRNKDDPKHELVEVAFPSFVPHLSAVRYRKCDHSIHKGVCIAGDAPSDTCYVIPLDTEMLQTKQYDKYWNGHWHEHIPGPDVEAVTIETLTEEEKGAYLAFVQYWKQREIS